MTILLEKKKPKDRKAYYKEYYKKNYIKRIRYVKAWQKKNAAKARQYSKNHYWRKIEKKRIAAQGI